MNLGEDWWGSDQRYARGAAEKQLDWGIYFAGRSEDPTNRLAIENEEQRELKTTPRALD